MNESTAIIAVPGFYEPISSLTHLIGAGVSLILGMMLMRRAQGDRGRVFAYAIYFITVVFMLSMSGVYHLLADGTGRDVLRRLDHAAIFALIVGTMTPIHHVLFRGFMRWGWIAFIWVLAATAITLKTIFFTGVPEWLGLGMYLVMGWLGLVSAYFIWRHRGGRYTRHLAAGGIAYTLGAICEFLHWPTIWPGVVGSHEVFHLAVLVGLGIHWHFIHYIADHPAPATPIKHGAPPDVTTTDA